MSDPSRRSRPNSRPTARTLRFDSSAVRFQRLQNAATRHGIAVRDVVLPAEGVVYNAAGLGLHYLEWPLHPGVREGDPAVILLHGGGLHAHTFDLLGNLLRRRARCIALDLRGHGDSDWAAAHDYGSQATADDIDTAIEALGVNRAVVAGHSMGGVGAMVWAARRRPALAGLVVLDVAPGMKQSGAAAVGDFVTKPLTFADLDEVDDYMAVAIPGNPTAGDGMAANLRWNDDGRLGFKYDTAQFLAANFVLGDQLREVARQISCPTKILRGARSAVLSAEAAAELADLVAGAAWIQIPNAGHHLQSSNPMAVVAEIEAMISEVTRADRSIDSARS